MNHRQAISMNPQVGAGQTIGAFQSGQILGAAPKPASPLAMRIASLDAQISEMNSLVSNLIEKASPVMQGDPRNADSITSETNPAVSVSCPLEGDLSNLSKRLGSTYDTLRSAIANIQL